MVNVIDYMPGDTLLHRLNPVVKLGLAAAIIIGIFLSDTYVALLGFLALTLALGAYAGVVDRLLSLLKLLIPLALIMLVLQLAFMRDGNVVWGFITDTGLITGSKACLRLLGVALPLILMLMVTKLNDLANACVEVLHVPYRYAFTFTTALRFVPVFGQEMNAIMEAQTARGVEYDTKNPVKKLKLMLPLCVPLLISSVGKTDATALAGRAARLLSAYARQLVQALPHQGPRHRRTHHQHRPHRHRLPVLVQPLAATGQRKRPRLAPNEPRPLLFSPDKTYQNKPVPFWQVEEARGGRGRRCG